MASKKEIETHLAVALKEVGKIKPWFDKRVKAWVFEHPAYPVGYSGPSAEDVIQNYPNYLREFIRQRLNDNLAPSVEKTTRGRGGRREGAGRPKGSKKEAKTRIYVPCDIAAWVNEHPSTAISSIRRLIARETR
jgi:hypothetical protein